MAGFQDLNEVASQKYDFIIVGAGAAGCVVASRLSANPSNKVLLIEAGDDFPPGHEPRAILDTYPSSSGEPKFAWDDLIAELGADVGDGRPVYSRKYTQGRLVGGSSNINGMRAQRGIPDDYDEWEQLGAANWNWHGVLPYFKKLENDLDFDGPLHGKHGPITIRRAPRSEWPPFPEAVARALEAEGFEYHEDAHDFFGDCISSTPMNNTPVGRVSSASAYLGVEQRNRDNLTILPNTVADRLVVEKKVVVGVEVRNGTGRHTIYAGETVVCCGGIQSPVLLMRSGIGPADHLTKAGIAVLVDRPGVGQNLRNHPAAYLAAHLPRSSKEAKSSTLWSTLMLRYSSKVPGCSDGDMHVFPASRSSWHPLGKRIAALAVTVYKPYSTGCITLNSEDPFLPPTIKFGLLSDKRDFTRLVDGLEKAARILASELVKPVINEVFVAPGGRANALNRPSAYNWLKSFCINLLFDFPFGLRRLLLRRRILDLQAFAADRGAREKFVRETAAGIHHPAGTCKIGRPTDPTAVVDPDLRVIGVEGLRIADASVMPTLPTGGAHIPVIMIGEKAADLILHDPRRAVTSLAHQTKA